MNKKLALAGICVLFVSTTALAQDARTVIANAQLALGNIESVTYSGSARNVAFQQCGASGVDMLCHGTHDPMRPIMEYARVIDLDAPASI